MFKHLSNISAIIAEPNRDFRIKIERALKQQGITNIESTGNINNVIQHLDNHAVDLIIADTTLPEGHLYDLIRDIRFLRKGKYAFPVIFAIINNATSEEVNKVINSGVDEILLKPFDMDDLLNRLNDVAIQRKRFVVTTSYIGPDRRSVPRPDSKPSIAVPNPLSGSRDVTRIEKTINEIREHRIESDAKSIKFSVTELESGILPDDIIENIITDLKAKSDELLEIADTTPKFKILKHHFLAMQGLTADIIAANYKLSDRDLYLLKSLTNVLVDMFIENRNEVGFRKEEK